jgi:hypothetical protein
MLLINFLTYDKKKKKKRKKKRRRKRPKIRSNRALFSSLLIVALPESHTSISKAMLCIEE